MTTRSEVLLVGCGKMGSAMLAGWLAADTVRHVTVVEPGVGSGPQSLPDDARINWVGDMAALPPDLAPDILIMAVKPQMMATVAPAYAPIVARGAVVLSIAAGKTLRVFADYFGETAAVVRAMPNTPAAVGRGITVAVANRHVPAAARAACDALLKAVGTVEWVGDEALIDPVTALSGGGPAYVFLLIETLATAGVRAGLPADLAMKLARETVTGSGELARQSAESAEQLRKNVTSPGGTTLAALNVLMAENGIQPLFDAAIAAATKRSGELAG